MENEDSFQMKRGIAGALARLLVRPIDRIPPPSRKVAIMVPVSTRPGFTEDERISLRHLRKFLDHYDKFLLVPEGMDVRLEGFEAKIIPLRYCGSAANHNRMLYRTDFWKMFADYEYVLMYHLDALVFSDQLEEWCGTGIDYIGAPFLQCSDAPWVRVERCGNGGFALYRVPSVLKVLRNRYLVDPSKYFEDRFWKLIEFQSKVLRPVRAAVPSWLKGRATAPLRGQLKKMDHVEVNERGNDLFWSDQARRFLPEFKVGTLEQGLAFAFEMEPRRCLERTGGKMPFGCHAFGRYDPGFWAEHLIKGDD